MGLLSRLFGSDETRHTAMVQSFQGLVCELTTAFRDGYQQKGYPCSSDLALRTFIYISGASIWVNKDSKDYISTNEVIDAVMKHAGTMPSIKLPLSMPQILSMMSAASAIRQTTHRKLHSIQVLEALDEFNPEKDKLHRFGPAADGELAVRLSNVITESLSQAMPFDRQIDLAWLMAKLFSNTRVLPFNLLQSEQWLWPSAPAT